MRDYGVDKPDLRVPLKLTELTDVMKDVDFKVFSGPGECRRRPRRGAVRAGRRDDFAQRDRRLHGVPARPGRQGPRLDQGERDRERARKACSRRSSSICTCRCAEGNLSQRTGAKDGDIIFFGADKAEACNAHLGALRQKVGHDRGLARKGLAAAVGGGLPDVRVRRGIEGVEGAPPPRSPAPRTATRRSSRPTRRRPTPRPTTWC